MSNFLRKKNIFFLTSFYAKNVFTVYNVFNFFFAHENMKKPASKVAEPAQIQPKSQFLFHKNLPPRDFSIMTLVRTRDYKDTFKLFLFVKIQKRLRLVRDKKIAFRFFIFGLF